MIEHLLARLEEVRRNFGGTKNADRIISELKYLLKLSYYNKEQNLKDIAKGVEMLEELSAVDKSITEATIGTIEKKLSHLSKWAKQIEVLCVAHAHIDMNWQWGWHETAQTTLDTFRTMLDMMEKFPDFTFSQSQASCYKIVEDYDPSMLKEIRKRVREGRWEVSASTWVEGDRNMSNCESLVRHFLYTRRYLPNLLDIPERDLNFDYEPDTFGHNANIPGILSKCGIKYYYFCRGYDNTKKAVFRWRSPDGGEIIAHAEPVWYMHVIQGKIFENVAEFCHENKVDKYLVIYGVGDHGGGPTRRDIETISAMKEWPLAPTVRFSTYREYYGYLEKIRSRLPVVEQEMNFVFDGCYTTQSRIKMANRFGEAAMYDAELYGALAASVAGKKYDRSAYEKAWRNVLFNHFHDILPGSGVTETREHALGLFQETMAIANTDKNNSLRAITSKINISGLLPEGDAGEGMSEGAGIGHGGKFWKMSQCERCDGKTRIYHVFNSLPFDREEAVEISVWAWNYDKARLVCTDGEGNVLPHQAMNENHWDWGYTCFQLMVKTKVPACGYSTIVITESDRINPSTGKDFNPRLITPPDCVLENDYLKAEFSVRGELKSLYDKKSGRELVDASRGAGVFRFGDERGGGMSAWAIWPMMTVEAMDQKVELLEIVTGDVRKHIRFKFPFRSSKLIFTVSLDSHSRYLEFKCEVDWREFGKANEFVPQLHYHLPLKNKVDKFINDIAAGVIERTPVDNDVPGLSFIAAGGVQLTTDCKYGYRCHDNSLTATLIRASFDPDEYPETGKHYIRFAIQPEGKNAKELQDNALLFCRRPDIISSYKRHGGDLPLSGRLISVKGQAELSCVKLSELDDDMIIRLYSLSAKVSEAEIELPGKIVSAIEVDGHELSVKSGAEISFSGSKLKVDLKPLTLHSIKVSVK